MAPENDQRGSTTPSISVRQGTEIVPIVPQVMRSHPGLTERGLHVEYHAIGPSEFPERELLQHNLFLYTGPAGQAEIKSPEFSGMQWIRPGSLWVMPAGSRHGVRFSDRVEGIALAFDPAHFDHLVQSADGKPALPIMQSLAACPPKIEHLMRALEYESNEPSGSDDIGLECIATVIALAVSRRAGAIPAASPKAGPQLAPRQIRAVQAHIAEHLHERLNLAALASIAGLSSFHFLRSFKGSMGETPAQYVLNRRIERARTLLESGNLSIGEVGISVGFEELSHFSRAFRRTVGVAPSTFRARVQI